MKNVGYDCAWKKRQEERCVLSVIIPIYNVESYLPQCLESVVTQIGAGADRKTEVILVDDGSTDRSGEIADICGREYSCVRVIHKENAGVAAARNDGIEAAQGDWLYFMDSDDWLSQDGISLILHAIKECPQADMILFDAWKNVGKRELPWEHFSQEAVWNSRDEIRRLQRGVLYYPMDYPKTKVPLAAPWDKLYRRAFLAENRLWFREELSVLDDMIFNMEVLGRAQQAAYKKYRVYHYRHVSSSITNRFRANRVEEDEAVWKMIKGYRFRHFSDAAGAMGQARIKAFDQAYFCRVIRSFAICCRLCFYHKDNGKSYREKQAYVREVAQSGLYREAFFRVQKSNLEWRLRVAAFFVRHDLYGGLYLLHRVEEWYGTAKKGWQDRGGKKTSQSPKN